MRRWTFHITTALSLLLMLATVGLWVASYAYPFSRNQEIDYGSRRTYRSITVWDGCVLFHTLDEPRDSYTNLLSTSYAQSHLDEELARVVHEGTRSSI